MDLYESSEAYLELSDSSEESLQSPHDQNTPDDIFKVEYRNGDRKHFRRRFDQVKFDGMALGYPVQPKSDVVNCGAYVCLYTDILLPKMSEVVLGKVSIDDFVHHIFIDSYDIKHNMNMFKVEILRTLINTCNNKVKKEKEDNISVRKTFHEKYLKIK